MPATGDYNVTAWTPQVEREMEFTTSSGAKCLLRKVQMEDLVELDIVDEIDSLTALVQTEHIDRVSGKAKGRKAQQTAKRKAEEAERQSVMSLMKDKQKFATVATVLDKIVMRCVIAPQILDPWINDPNEANPQNPTGRRKLTQNEREANSAYIDYIDLRDKMAIFGEVFESMEDLEKFREESQENLGPVEAQPEHEADSGRDDGSDE